MLQPSNSETGQLQSPYFKDFCVHSHQRMLLIFPASCMQDPSPSLAHAYISLQTDLSLSPPSCHCPCSQLSGCQYSAVCQKHSAAKRQIIGEQWVNSARSTSPKHLETGLLLNCSRVCDWAGYRLGSADWVFLSKLKVCFAVTAESESGKNISIILEEIQKWINGKWRWCLPLPTLNSIFYGYEKRLMLPKLWALWLYHTFNTKISPGRRSYTVLLSMTDFVFPACAPKPLTIQSILAAW